MLVVGKRPKEYNFKSRSSQFRDFKIKRVGQSQPKAIKFTLSDIILKAVLKQNLSHALLSSRRWKGEGWIRWLLKSVWVEKFEYHFFHEILPPSLFFIFLGEKKKFKKSWSEKIFLFHKKNILEQFLELESCRLSIFWLSDYLLASFWIWKDMETHHTIFQHNHA